MKFKLGDKVTHRLLSSPMVIIGVPTEHAKCAKPCSHCEVSRYHLETRPIEYRVRLSSPKGLITSSFLECELEASR